MTAQTRDFLYAVASIASVIAFGVLLAFLLTGGF